jgi:type IV pilus assembly protein PilA
MFTANLSSNHAMNAAPVSHDPRPLQSQRRVQRGQGMTEYIIIVALIAVAAIGVYKYFGQTVRSQTAGLAQELAGNNASAEITAAGTAATAAVGQAGKKTLGTYNGGN